VNFGSNEVRALPRALVEQTPSIDIRQLRRQGAWREGVSLVIEWPVFGAAIEAELRGEIFVARYAVQSAAGSERSVEEVIQTSRLPLNFGGLRHYFQCPACGRRAYRLFVGVAGLRCRCCSRLAYASQRQDACLRAARRAAKIRMRLGGSEDLLDLFPDRPKRQWRRTYARLKAQAEAAEATYAAGLAPYLERAVAALNGASPKRATRKPGRRRRRTPLKPAVAME
jgi:hypothetical protein